MCRLVSTLIPHLKKKHGFQCSTCMYLSLQIHALFDHQNPKICQSFSCHPEERSQLMNKAKGLALLKAKLLVIAEEQRASEIKEIRGDVVKAEWGQQIRNYVLHPYKLVKDVRTGVETTDVTAVMDGDLGAFMKAYLRSKYSQIPADVSI